MTLTVEPPIDEIRMSSEVPMDNTATISNEEWDVFERMAVGVENERVVTYVIDCVLRNVDILGRGIGRRLKHRTWWAGPAARAK